MKPKELRQKSISELNEIIKDKRRKLLEIKYHNELIKIKNVKEVKNLKRDIARILTIINSHKL